MNVELISITPDAEKTMAHIARVSNPDNQDNPNYCLLYTSDAADEEDSVDLGGRRII